MSRSAVATDNFNRVTLGANWTQIHTDQDTIKIGGSDYIYNEFAIASGNGAAARWDGAGSFANDQYSSLLLDLIEDLGDSNYTIGVICRASADDNTARDYYFAAVCMNGAASKITQFGKLVNGTRTQLHSASVAWSNGDRIELECEGTTIRVCKNGTPLGGSFTVTDTSLSTGKPGVHAGAYSGIRGDDWEGGDLVAAGGTERHQTRRMIQAGGFF